MSDKYKNWPKALLGGVVPTLGGALMATMQEGPAKWLSFGAVLVLSRAGGLYLYPERAAAPKKYTPGSLSAMLLWNITGAHLTAACLARAGMKGLEVATDPIGMTFVNAFLVGGLLALAHREQSYFMTFLVGALIGAAGIPQACMCVASPELFEMSFLTYAPAYLVVVLGNRIGAGLWRLIDSKGE